MNEATDQSQKTKQVYNTEKPQIVAFGDEKLSITFSRN